MPEREVWVTTLTMRGSLDEEEFDAWASALYGLSDEASLAQSSGQVYVTVWFEDASDHLHALRLAEELLQKSGVHPRLPVIGAESRTEMLYTRNAEEPSLPELVGVSEVSAILGISRQRVHQLVRAALIPAPLAILRGGFVWDAASMRSCAESRKGARRWSDVRADAVAFGIINGEH